MAVGCWGGSRRWEDVDLHGGLMLRWRWGGVLGTGLWGGGARRGGACSVVGAIEAVSQMLKESPSDRRLESGKSTYLSGTLAEPRPELVQHTGVCGG